MTKKGQKGYTTILKLNLTGVEHLGLEEAV
jgi:hypothetical protein